MKVSQSYPTLCDPMGYTDCVILQARILEWVPKPRHWTEVSCIAADSLLIEPQVRPMLRWVERNWPPDSCFLNLEILSFYSTVGSSHPWQYCEALSVNMGFPGGTSGKEPACQYGRHKRHKICGFTPWVRKIPWRRAHQPTPGFLPRESYGQRSLVSYSPWGCKKLDTTEGKLSRHTSVSMCRIQIQFYAHTDSTFFPFQKTLALT